MDPAVDLQSETLRPKKRTGTSKYDFVKVKVWLGPSRSHYYVLSRFLISRMLTLSKIPYIKAVKIALEVKKHLVDHSMLEVTQEELECILLQLITAKGMGSQYIDCYKMVTQFFQQRQPLVIVICGTAWTGKSTIAQQLASRINIPNIMLTDVIYELLQGQPGSGVQPGSLCLRPGLEGQQLIEEFQRECTIVRRGMDGDFIKTLSSGKPLIVEGLHLDPAAFIAEFESLGLVMLPAGATRSRTVVQADTPGPSPRQIGSTSATSVRNQSTQPQPQLNASTGATAAAAEDTPDNGQLPGVVQLPTGSHATSSQPGPAWQHHLPAIPESADLSSLPCGSSCSAGSGLGTSRLASDAAADMADTPALAEVPALPLWQPVLPAWMQRDPDVQQRSHPGSSPELVGPPLLLPTTSSTQDAACISREHSTTEVVSREDSFASGEEEAAEDEEAEHPSRRAATRPLAAPGIPSNVSSSSSSSRARGRVRHSRRTDSTSRDSSACPAHLLQQLLPAARNREQQHDTPQVQDSSTDSSRSDLAAAIAAVHCGGAHLPAAGLMSSSGQQFQGPARPGSSTAAAGQSLPPPTAQQQQQEEEEEAQISAAATTQVPTASGRQSLQPDNGAAASAPPQHVADLKHGSVGASSQQQQQQPQQLEQPTQQQQAPATESLLQPLFVPVVLCMDPADHIMVAEEALSHLTLAAASANHHTSNRTSPAAAAVAADPGAEAASNMEQPPAAIALADATTGTASGGTAAAAVSSSAAAPTALDVQQALQRAQVLQDYLCSFEVQGLPIVRVSYGCFGEALDKLHEYVLQCIKEAMQWNGSGTVQQGASQ